MTAVLGSRLSSQCRRTTNERCGQSIDQKSSTGRKGSEPVVAFFESCRWIGALPGAGASDWFRRRSIFVLTPANGR